MSEPDSKKWKALWLLCAAQFIVILDTSIIGIALPAIQRALGMSQAGLQWVFNAYVIVFGGLLLLGGRLADLFGSRRIFAAGFTILTFGSLLAGLAGSEAALLIGRGAQGLGAALIAPSALTIVMSLFGGTPQLGKALGLWGASAAAGGTAGVFLGGVITQWLSWRWAFLVNVPLGVLVLALTPALLERYQPRRGRIDVAGALSVTSAIVLLVYALVTGEQAGWASAQTLGTGLGGAVLLAIFVALQRRGSSPLVSPAIFARPNLSVANVVMALLGAAWIPMWFFLNLYLQQILRLSAFGSGLALLPMTVAIMILMVKATGAVVARFGFKTPLVVGLVLLGGAMLLLTAAPTDGSFVTHVLPASLLGALGMSLAYVPVTMAGMSGARPEETGLASGLISTSYQLGSALGLAGMVAMSGAFTSSRLAAGVAGPAAMNAGFQVAFLGAAVLAFVGAGLSALALRAPAADAATPSVAPIA